MAPVLRSDSTAILQHFLRVVTDLKADDVICKSLERYGVTILPDLLDLDREDIKALDYVDEDEDNTITPIHRGGQGRIRVMQAYVRYLSEEEIDDIQSLDHHDFNAFRMDIYDPNEQPTPSPMKPKKSSPSTDIRQPADDFKKSIKRDKTQYKVFKEDKQWDNWRRTTIATARSHGCEDVFNPSYIPSSTEDLNLFEEKQKFIYSVFNDCLQTDMGKSLVRLHESDYDAHEIYKKLLAHATTSTQATIDSNELLSYLTSTKLNKTQWRGTHHAFVLHWCDQLRKYEDLMDKKDHFSNNVKMVMLQNAVAGVSALHNVKIQAAHDVAHGKSPLNYDSYKVLLLSAATVEDERLSFSRQRPQRTINFHQQDQHDVHFSEMGSPPDVDLFFDIDTDISSLDINVTDRANKTPYKAPFRPSMNRDQWNSLSAEEKTIWDSFSPQAKATILGFRKPSPKPSLQQKINLHDITAADYLCLLHNQSQDTNAPDDNSTSSKTSDNEQSDPKPEDTDTTSSYNEILDMIEKDDTEDGLWRFKSITGHQGPLSKSDSAYKGSRYNVLVNWETGESTYEPLHIIAADDPVSCAIYAKKNDLLDKEGWKRFKRLARRQKKIVRLMNQAKLHSFRTKPIYMFGHLVPRNHDQAMKLDEDNGNKNWKNAEMLELKQIQDYKTFLDKGKHSPIPPGYKKIRVHFVYAVKHDGRFKVRLVAGGHLTDTPVDSVYSSVVSLRGLRLVIFLGELNGLDTWATDIGNAYE